MWCWALAHAFYRSHADPTWPCAGKFISVQGLCHWWSQSCSAGFSCGSAWLPRQPPDNVYIGHHRSIYLFFSNARFGVLAKQLEHLFKSTSTWFHNVLRVLMIFESFWTGLMFLDADCISWNLPLLLYFFDLLCSCVHLVLRFCPRVSWGKLPAHEQIETFKFELSPESIAAWKETREKTAEGWQCSFLAPEATGEKRKKTRRARIFQRARRAANKVTKLEKKEQKKLKDKKNKKHKKEMEKKKKVTLEKIKEPKKIEPTEANFGRSDKGRKLVKQEMATLLTLDLEKFPSKPAFEADGTCRLKIPAAAGMTWSTILEIAPIYFETVFISTRSRAEYGRAVFQHFDVIKKQMGREERTGWLRLLRTLCEMPRPKQDSKSDAKASKADGTADWCRMMLDPVEVNWCALKVQCLQRCLMNIQYWMLMDHNCIQTPFFGTQDHMIILYYKMAGRDPPWKITSIYI